jgi:hypothetical protein
LFLIAIIMTLRNEDKGKLRNDFVFKQRVALSFEGGAKATKKPKGVVVVMAL